MIRLHFTKDPGLTPLIVRAATWCEYDHVEFDLPYGYLGARPDGGVQVRPKDKYKPIKECFGVIECDDATTRRVLQYAKLQLDKPYDWSAIYGIALHRDWRNEDEWICSELIAGAFEKAGDPIFNGDNVNRFSPRDIYINPRVKLEIK